MKRFLPAWGIVAAVIALCSCRPQKAPEPVPTPEPKVSTPAPHRDATDREQKVFGSLDLEFPGLEKVKAAIGAGDYDLATRELASYYRSRTKPAWRVNPDQKPRFNKEKAEAASEGRLAGGYVEIEHAFPNGKVDWLFNATTNVPGVAFNHEWQWQLNRMMFWSDLGKAYLATGDEKYARAFASQMRGWVADCPTPARIQNVEQSTWRTIEAGIRMGGAWPDAFHAFLRSPSFTDADIVTMLGSFVDHARYLRKFPTVGNFLTMEMSGLYTVGALFPEFREASDWRAFASATLAADVARQFLPDGGQVELTPGYHNVALDNMLAIVEAARITGCESELDPSFVPSLERAYEYNLALLTPEQNLPKCNDSWSPTAKYLFAKGVTFFPARQDFRWALTAGKEGVPPAYTSRFLDWSGYAVMRSGWGAHDNFLVFDVGPTGLAHIHQDKLNLVLWAWGREILFDGGGASYERSKWRDYSITTASHNCVMVDGLNQNVPEGDWASTARYKNPACVSQAPIDAGWISSAAFDYAKAAFDNGFGPRRTKIASHERQVLFLKPDVFIVADKLSPGDELEHTYQARWHLLTTKTEQMGANVTTSDPSLANLAIIPLVSQRLAVRTASAEETPEILGWNIRKDTNPPLVPATTVLHTRQGTGPQHFLTLLLPLKPGQASPVTNVTEGPVTEVTLSDGRKISVSTKDGLSVQEYLPDGRNGRNAMARP